MSSELKSATTQAGSGQSRRAVNFNCMAGIPLPVAFFTAPAPPSEK